MKVQLAKKWGKRKSGTVVEVDDLRASWLQENSFVVEEAADASDSESGSESAKKNRGRTRRRVEA